MFKAAYGYQDNALALPVTDIDVAAAWYTAHFGMTEVARRSEPHAAVILERDGVQLGFAITGGDAEQDGAAILVTDIHAAKADLEARGVAAGELREEDREGKRLNVFFVIAPDGLCYYFHAPT